MGPIGIQLPALRFYRPSPAPDLGRKIWNEGRRRSTSDNIHPLHTRSWVHLLLLSVTMLASIVVYINVAAATEKPHRSRRFRNNGLPWTPG